MNLFKSMTMNAETRLMLLAEKVIAEHGAPILEALGMTDNNDGILDKITVSKEVNTDTPAGVFISGQRSKGFMGRHGVSYVKGSGSIVLYPLTAFHVAKGETVRKIPFASILCLLFRKGIERHLIEIFAHELRHYWQYSTGVVYQKGDYLGSSRFTPYSMRWEEKDANEWAAAYLKSCK